MYWVAHVHFKFSNHFKVLWSTSTAVGQKQEREQETGKKVGRQLHEMYLRIRCNSVFNNVIGSYPLDNRNYKL